MLVTLETFLGALHQGLKYRNSMLAVTSFSKTKYNEPYESPKALLFLCIYRTAPAESSVMTDSFDS